MTNVHHRQYQCDEQNISCDVVQHVIERSLSEEDFLGADDKLSARWLVVWVLSQIVYHQPAKDLLRS